MNAAVFSSTIHTHSTLNRQKSHHFANSKPTLLLVMVLGLGSKVLRFWSVIVRLLYLCFDFHTVP